MASLVTGLFLLKVRQRTIAYVTSIWLSGVISFSIRRMEASNLCHLSGPAGTSNRRYDHWEDDLWQPLVWGQYKTWSEPITALQERLWCHSRFSAIDGQLIPGQDSILKKWLTILGIMVPPASHYLHAVKIFCMLAWEGRFVQSPFPKFQIGDRAELHWRWPLYEGIDYMNRQRRTTFTIAKQATLMSGDLTRTASNSRISSMHIGEGRRASAFLPFNGDGRGRETIDRDRSGYRIIWTVEWCWIREGIQLRGETIFFNGYQPYPEFRWQEGGKASIPNLSYWISGMCQNHMMKKDLGKQLVHIRTFWRYTQRYNANDYVFLRKSSFLCQLDPSASSLEAFFLIHFEPLYLLPYAWSIFRVLRRSVNGNFYIRSISSSPDWNHALFQINHSSSKDSLIHHLC